MADETGPGAEVIDIRQALLNAEDAPAEAPEPDNGGGGGGGGGGRRFQNGRDFRLPENCPVTPLGKEGASYHYLDRSHQLVSLTARDHSKNHLAGLFAGEIQFLWQHWPRWSKPDRDGNVTQIGWAADKVGEALMQACAERGIWSSEDRVREAGAWRGEAGELILHVGDGLIFGPPTHGALAPAPLAGGYPAHRPGRYGAYIYPAKPPGPRPAEAPQASVEVVELEQALQRWFWRREETSPRLLLGWLAAAMIGGALRWRPAVWLSGEKISGKSTLQDVVKAVMGADLLWRTDASAANLWQRVGHSSRPIALDEQEAERDNRAQSAIVKLFRQASSGGKIGRGGADHKGAEFNAMSAFLFSSILVPPLKPQDMSRLAVLELRQIPDGVAPYEPDLKAFARTGLIMRRRLLDQWPRFEATLERYGAALAEVGHGVRGRAQFGTLLAAADLVLADAAPDPEVCAGWAAELQAGEMDENRGQGSDWEACIGYLLSLQIEVYARSAKRSIGELITIAAGLPVDGVPSDLEATAANRHLSRHGLRYVEADGGKELAGRWLAVSQSHAELAKLFRDTHWRTLEDARPPWIQTLLRVPGASYGKRETRRFDQTPTRFILVPIDKVLGLDEDELAGVAAGE